MNCWKCGKPMNEGARFCPHCGTVITGGDPAGQGSANAGQTGKKRRKGALIAGVAVAVLAVVIVAAAVVFGLLASPKGTVGRALAKTAAAYADAGQSLGLPDWSSLTEKRAFSQRISLTLDSVGSELSFGRDLSSLKGMGLQAGTNFDQKGRKMDVEVTAFYGGEDLASVQMLADGDKLLLASPEFTKDVAYGLNTTTLGKDLYRLGVEDERVRKIGFNLFDLIEKAAPTDAETEEMNRAMDEAGKELVGAVKVEKGGKEDIQVNGKSVNAERFHVVIPKEAVENYIRAVEGAMQTVDTTARMRDILRSMGFDTDMVNEVISRMGDAAAYGEMFSRLKRWADTANDMELDMYLSGGYLCAVKYSGLIANTETEITLQLGGGENYVDDLSLEIAANGDKLSVVSTGNHAGKDGVFTDVTTVKLGFNRVVSSLSYEPKASRDNFQWDLNVDNMASASMTGQLTAGKDSAGLKLDEIVLKAAGTTLISLEAEWYLGPYEGTKVSMPTQKLLGDMDLDGLTGIVEDLQGNVIAWAMEAFKKLPAGLVMSLYG